MTTEEFKAALVEYYHGEIMGEAVMEQMLKHFLEPEQHRRLAVLLQLETETKARLRPEMLAMGLKLDEEDIPREQGLAAAAALKDLTWKQAMGAMCEQLPPVVEHYRDLAERAPAPYRELAESMYVHEKSLLDFATMELKGDSIHSIDPVAAQLHFKV